VSFPILSFLPKICGKFCCFLLINVFFTMCRNCLGHSVNNIKKATKFLRCKVHSSFVLIFDVNFINLLRTC